jgi:hypothetical protein
MLANEIAGRLLYLSYMGRKDFQNEVRWDQFFPWQVYDHGKSSPCRNLKYV